MKITVIGPYPPFRGGISDFNFSMCKELSKHNEIQIINFSTQYPKLLFPGKTQFKSDYSDKYSDTRILSSINALSWWRTANKVKEFKPDLIILQYWMPFFSFAYKSIIKNVKKHTNIKVLAICHNLTPHEDKGFYQYLTKRFLNLVDKFIVMSNSVKQDILKLKPNSEYKTLFHPIYDLYGTEIDNHLAKDTLKIDAKNVILFFGLIREYKGLDILIKSIPFIKDTINSIKVIIAGECYEDPQKYIKIIKDLKIEQYIDWRMEFIPDDDVVKYFSAADIVVLPYRTATQSGVTQIAYNFNRPVILSNVGGLSEIVDNRKTGFIVNPNPEDLSLAIKNFFQEDKFQEFSNNIKDFKKQYSWKTFSKQLMDFSAK